MSASADATLDPAEVYRTEKEKYAAKTKMNEELVARLDKEIEDRGQMKKKLASAQKEEDAKFKDMENRLQKEINRSPKSKKPRLMKQSGGNAVDLEPEHTDVVEGEEEEEKDEMLVKKKHQMVMEFKALKKPLMTLDEIKEHLETTKYDIPRIKNETGLKRGKAGKLAKFDVAGSGKMTQKIMSALFYRLENEGVLKTRHGSRTPVDSPAPPPPPPNEPVMQSAVSIHPNNGLVNKDSTEEAENAENEPVFESNENEQPVFESNNTTECKGFH